MAGPKLTLYVDVVSPFAYMAYYVLRHSPAFTTLPITYTPVFLGGIMQSTGNTPPLRIKNKDKWIETERKRWSRLFSIPIAQESPPGFPINTLHVQRALCAVELKRGQGELVKVLDCFFEEVWGVRRNEGSVHDPKQGLPVVLGKVLGEEGAREVLEAMGTDEVKKHLQANTSKAMEDGAFGLPYFVATNAKGETEAFWGFDHLAQVVEHLGLDRNKLGGGVRAML